MNTQKQLKIYLLSWFIMTISLMGSSQSASEKFAKTMKFDPGSGEKVFILVNINGDVNIQGHTGNEVKIIAEKQFSDKTKANKLTVATIEKGDTIIVYLKGKCLNFGYNDCTGPNMNYGWNYNWNQCNNCNNCYSDYRFDFNVQLPQNTHVAASTINQGQVNVKKVTGSISARNINGGISLEEVSNQAHVNTINGNIKISYSKNPTKFSSYYSLNGDINATFIKELSADIAFKSFNGELFTNIEDLEMMPNEIAKNQSSKGLNFKIEEKKKIKFRNGGTLLDFETFNGDVYIKE